MFSLKVEVDKNMLLREYLQEELKLSSRLVKKVKSPEGSLRVNGIERTVRYKLEQGDRLEVVFPPENISESIVPESMDLHIVYEDEHVLVIDKEAGLPTIPSQLHPNGTVANGVLYYYQQHHLPYTIHVVTRLDKDTSGLLLIAKHQYSHSLLTDEQRLHRIARTYQAIVHGTLQKKRGTIDAPIGRKANSIIERTVTADGKRAVTHYEVVKEFGDYSLVKVELETGRTHQIRVHFSHLGHPLVGDDLYGGKKEICQRHALHCAKLTFFHPLKETWLEFSSSLPKDMNDLFFHSL